MTPLNAASLRQVATETRAQPCSCALGACAGWESFTEERWPKALMQRVGTLRAAAVDEPTTDEFHPQGTRYESPDAPLAVAYFPCNRCEVHACSRCHRLVLRYTEFGGYYIDHRVREVNAALVV